MSYNGPLPYCLIAVRPNGSSVVVGVFKDIATAVENRKRYEAGLLKAEQPPCTYEFYKADWSRVDYMTKEA